MSSATAKTLFSSGLAPERAQRTAFQRVIRSLTRNRMAILGLVIFIAEIVVAIGAPLVSPRDPLLQVRSERLLAPGGRGEESGTVYLLGTDALGRDVLSRVIYGARVSLLIGFVSVAISAPLGVTLGLIAGYYRGVVDDIIMRIADVQLAFPFILLALAVVAVLGPTVRNIIVVLGISGWVLFARVVRGDVLSLAHQDFVSAARVSGCRDRRIVFRHILPNVLSPVIVLATFAIAYMILLEAGLSFLGLGVKPPTPAWGSMLSDARNYVATAWWISVFPGVAIMITVLSVNFLGDWLRDLLDPRERLL